MIHRRRWRAAYLVQDEPAGLPLCAVSSSLVQVPRQGVVIVGPLREIQQLILVHTNSSLHLRAQHIYNAIKSSAVVIQQSQSPLKIKHLFKVFIFNATWICHKYIPFVNYLPKTVMNVRWKNIFFKVFYIWHCCIFLLISVNFRLGLWNVSVKDYRSQANTKAIIKQYFTIMYDNFSAFQNSIFVLLVRRNTVLCFHAIMKASVTKEECK
jgi:hypothetical protein